MVYKTIFNIIVNHGYFLDEGEDKFSNMNQKEKEGALKNYDINDYLRIAPTEATKTIMNNHRLLFRPHAFGFRILAETIEKKVALDTKYSPLILLADDLNFTFRIVATDPFFDSYSQIVSRDDMRLYLFTNKKPSTEADGFANIFTSDGTIDTSFLLKENSTRKLVYEVAKEDESLKTISNLFSIANIPVANIDKVEEVKQIRRYVRSKKRNGLLGFIRLRVKGDANHNLFEFDNSDPTHIKQYVLGTAPEFTLRFKNRKTFWRYINTSKNFMLTTKATKPLTKNGFVKIEASDFDPEPTVPLNYPNPRPDSIKKENNKYYSEIFI